jgi:hypothetical protein
MKRRPNMKYAKMMGLAVLAITAFMAISVASASAKGQVCSTAGTGTACAGTHGKQYTGKIVASNIGNVVLHTYSDAAHTVNKNTTTCTSSVAEGEVTNGATGTGKITKQTFAGCSSEACPGSPVDASTTATTAAPWPATATTGSGGNGTMDVTDPTGTFTCTIFGFPFSCGFTTAKAEVTVDGSHTEPRLTANVTMIRHVGSVELCGTGARWTGTYKVTTPTSLWIT